MILHGTACAESETLSMVHLQSAVGPLYYNPQPDAHESCFFLLLL